MAGSTIKDPSFKRWTIVVDEISGKIGRVLEQVPARDHASYILILAQLSDGKKVTFFPERVRYANQTEIEHFARAEKGRK